ncbi:MAG: GIY-YIG nuclease family protein [bacterium]|nr:GIY-YIG nuclease family protein [bacterium]
MWYVYILKSIHNKTFYIGFTANPAKRIAEHNAGQSFHTKKYLPWKTVYLEGYANYNDARDRERKLKQYGKVYAQLKRRINRSISGAVSAPKVRG